MISSRELIIAQKQEFSRVSPRRKPDPVGARPAFAQNHVQFAGIEFCDEAIAQGNGEFEVDQRMRGGETLQDFRQPGRHQIFRGPETQSGADLRVREMARARLSVSRIIRANSIMASPCGVTAIECVSRISN
jgi:hypothetical protein